MNRQDSHSPVLFKLYSVLKSLIPFYGVGEVFQLRLARRRAHPCDKQAKSVPVLFLYLMHLKVRDSILSDRWGPAVANCPDNWRVSLEGGLKPRTGDNGRGGAQEQEYEPPTPRVIQVGSSERAL